MRERVLAAAADWVWVPPDATEAFADDYRLTHYQDRSTVQWSRTARPVRDLAAEVVAAARAAGRRRVRWWVTAATAPGTTEGDLVGLGFRQVEVVEVLALDLTSDLDRVLADLRVPPDVEVRPADDEAALRTAGSLDADIFGWDPPSEVQLAHGLAAVRAGLATGPWTERRFLAWWDGEPVGTGGCTFAADVLRLWGGGVVARARGRGAYRALLATRCRFGAEHGAAVALVKGRLGTSAPVLLRAGFTGYGQERCYELGLDGPASDGPASDGGDPGSSVR